MRRRYGVLTALLYDVFSGERPLYRAGRLAAIDALRLRPGDRVLVLGCGTGLDLPPIAAAIGTTGTIVAVDVSRTMLRTAARRRRTPLGRPRAGWPALRLVHADLIRARSVLPPGVAPVDAVLAVDTLSLIPEWWRAWQAGAAVARSGARAAIADVGRPAADRRVLRAWARWISFVGGGDLDARPWTVLEGEDVAERLSRKFHAGHVQLRAATLR